MFNLKNKTKRWVLLSKELNIGTNLTLDEQKSLLNLCKHYENIFYINGDKLSYTKEITHKIPTTVDLAPINQKNYRFLKHIKKSSTKLYKNS